MLFAIALIISGQLYDESGSAFNNLHFEALSLKPIAGYLYREQSETCFRL